MSDPSSSFDSSNSFYSTDSSSNGNLLQLVEDEEYFNGEYQPEITRKIQMVLQEIRKDDRFDCLVDTPTVKVDTCNDPTAPFCFRTSADFPTHSAAAAFALFADVKERAQWDAMCQAIQVLKQLDPLTFIYHLQLHGSWPATPRDSLMLAAFRKLKDGRYISVAWSIEDDQLCPPDPSGAFIRMHTRISANLFTPTSSTSFQLCQLIDADPKGSIPSYLIKKVSAKSFPATIESIKQAISRRSDSESFYIEMVSQDYTIETPISESGSTQSHQFMDSLIIDELRRIQNRLERIEKRQAEQAAEKLEFDQIIKWAPVAISTISLLLLLNMNLRKK